MNISKEQFLEKYNFEQDILEKNNIEWEILKQIYIDFEDTKEKLEEYSNLIAGLLRKQEKVHTVRTRIKNPEHLIAKLIRKTPERKVKYGDEFQFTLENYKKEITDLIGVRVIHIFKEDWLSIHDFISGNWHVKEYQANIREGDNQVIYTELGIGVNSRKTGYRSVHYLIEFMPTNEKITAEIQVRTIFEEGYGEIDHQLSYPNNNVPEVLTLNLLMLNRLAGSADEMASAVKIIKEEWGKLQISLSEKDKELANLKTIINELDIQQDQKDSLVEGLDRVVLNKNSYSVNLDNAYINLAPVTTSLSSLAGAFKFNDSLAKSVSSAASAFNLNDSVVKSLSTPVSDSNLDFSGIRGLNLAKSNSKLEDLRLKKE